MKTTKEAVAAFVAAAALAEKGYGHTEQAVVEDIATALEIKGFAEAVECEMEAVRSLEGQQLAGYLLAAAQKVTEGEEAMIMEAVLQIVLADGELAYTEAQNLLIVADLLKMEHALVMLMLADLQKEREITVKFEI